MKALLLDGILFRSILMIALMLCFLGIWAWAWSKNRKADFHHASRLPLEEDQSGTISEPEKNAGNGE